jgi:hypothetical protein
LRGHATGRFAVVRQLIFLVGAAIAACALSLPTASIAGAGSNPECAWQPTLPGAPSQSLLAILGVLRRPATPADHAPNIIDQLTRPVNRLLGREVYTNYLRRARVFDGATYYIVPIRYDGCGAIKPGGDGIWLGSTGGGGGGSNANDIEQGKFVGTGGPGIPGNPHSGTVQMVVPDGVASATISYPAGPANGFKPNNISPPVTITATATGNVLLFNVPRSSGGGQIVHPTSMDWRDANGQVVRRFRGRL